MLKKKKQKLKHKYFDLLFIILNLFLKIKLCQKIELFNITDNN